VDLKDGGVVFLNIGYLNVLCFYSKEPNNNDTKNIVSIGLGEKIRASNATNN